MGRHRVGRGRAEILVIVFIYPGIGVYGSVLVQIGWISIGWCHFVLLPFRVTWTRLSKYPLGGTVLCSCIAMRHWVV